MPKATYSISSDKTRQAFHLTGERGWINDPNGLIYYGGEYHAFYQYHPYSTQWGPMHWGHAVSRDLVKWKYLPIALYPDRDYDIDGCFSGTSIKVGNRLYLMYTGVKADGGGRAAHQVQCLAYSDDGVHFFKHEKNPVIGSDMLPEGYSPFDFRDPKVFEKEGVYYCIAAARKIGGGGRFLVYKSANLVDWTFCRDIFDREVPNGDMTECPDCYDPYKLLMCCVQYINDGRLGNKNVHTALYAAGDKISPEDFDPVDYGFDFYAPQTFFDGKNLYMIAWLQMWDRNIPSVKFGWAGGMTLPRILTVKDGKLIQTPCDLSAYYDKTDDIAAENLKKPVRLSGECYVLNLTAEKAAPFTLELKKGDGKSVSLSYDAEKKELVFCRANSGELIIGVEKDDDSLASVRRMPLGGVGVDVTVVADRFSVEVFAEGKSLSATVCAPFGADGIELSGDLENLHLVKHELKAD